MAMTCNFLCEQVLDVLQATLYRVSFKAYGLRFVRLDDLYLFTSRSQNGTVSYAYLGKTKKCA